MTNCQCTPDDPEIGAVPVSALTREARLAYQELGVRRFMDDLRLHDVETVSALPYHAKCAAISDSVKASAAA